MLLVGIRGVWTASDAAAFTVACLLESKNGLVVQLGIIERIL